MKKRIFTLCHLLLAFSIHAQVDVEDMNIEFEKGLSSRWFKVIPESRAHVARGTAFNQELDPNHIKALVWNVKKALMVNFKKEFLKFGKGQDLFVIQEAYESPVFESTIDTFNGPQWDWGLSFLYRLYNNQATGTLIGSMASPSDVKVRHSKDREPIICTPKAITFGKYNIKGRDDDLLVISVHAINVETTGAFKRFMNIIEEEIRSHDGPVLLAGDFNTWNASRSSYLNRFAEKNKFSHADYINGEARMEFGGWPLDHILVRGINLKKTEVIGNSRGSDHKPFLIEMSIP